MKAYCRYFSLLLAVLTILSSLNKSVFGKETDTSTYVDNNDTTCTKDESATAYCDHGCGTYYSTSIPSFGHSYTKELIEYPN